MGGGKDCHPNPILKYKEETFPTSINPQTAFGFLLNEILS
jgi:hypothetical protein